MLRRRKAFLLGCAGLVALCLLGALHIAELTWEVGAFRINGLLNVVTAWFAFGGLLLAASGEGKKGRLPWALMAGGLGLLSICETLLAYVTIIVEKNLSLLWLLNFGFLGGYVVIIASLVVKARSLPQVRISAVKLILIIVVAAISAFTVWQTVRLVVSQPAIPTFIKLIILMFPAVDSVMLFCAVYVFTTFGAGVAGRPWGAVAVGVLLLGAADLVQVYAPPYREAGAIILGFAAMAQFASYASIYWGAWYQRALLKTV